MARGGTWDPYGVLPPMGSSPADYQSRRAGADVCAAWKIGVTNEGLFRIPYPALASIGLTNPVGSQLRIFCRTQEVARYVTTAGTMGPGDFVQFYGTGHAGYYSNTNAYWLGLGGTGLAVQTRSCPTSALAPVVTSHWPSVVSSAKLWYRPYDFPEDEAFDHWFADYLVPGRSSTTTLLTGARQAGTQAVVTLTIRGMNAVAHSTQVSINSTVVTNFTYSGITAFVGRCAFSSALLSDGLSTIQLTDLATGTEAADWEEVALLYPRRLTATNGSVLFWGVGGTNNYTVSGLTTNTGLWLWDITGASAALTNYSLATVSGGFTVSFGDVSAASNRYALFQDSAVTMLTNIETVTFRDLVATNRQADCLVICPYAFRSETYRLLKHRYRDGVNVAVAPITDVYNEFSYGIKDAAAIKQFIGYAFHHWSRPQPQAVLLIGDGSYDPQNWERRSNAVDMVPVHLGPTPEQWTALDNWYVTVTGADFFVYMALGRIAASSITNLGHVVDKIVAYEAATNAASWRTNATLVAGRNSGIDFATASENYIASHLAPKGFTTSKFYGDSMTPTQIRNSTQINVNQGQYLLTFFGHGAEYFWSWDGSSSSVWNNNDVGTLTNTNYPIAAMFTCKNGMFHLSNECLAEVFIETNSHGAVAAVAASSLSEQPDAENLADGFVGGLVSNQVERLGAALQHGLLHLWNYNPSAPELLTYEVFGDPELIVNPK